jgi:hypothetical protein
VKMTFQRGQKLFDLKDGIKRSRLHLTAEIFYNLYWLFLIRPKWYSQTGEDVLIAKYLPEDTGKYLDIGAGLPIRGSNTYFLYKRGWSGVVVDPISLNIKLSRAFRPRDFRFQTCIGMSETEIFFYEFIPYGYSTIEESVALQLLESGNAKLRSKTIMKVVPASALAPSMKPSDATFLSIDIEGAEFEALSSIDWEVTTPRVICVEEWDRADVQGRIAGLLTEKGYVLKERTALSAIYVHQNWLSAQPAC